MSSENQESSSLSNIEPEDILANFDGIPLPPAIKKNLWKSVGRLITGLVDVPVALLEAKVQKIKSEANGLSLVTKSASEAVAKEFKEDRYLIDRTVSHFGAKLLREQVNRESIVEKATNELKNDPPKEDTTKEIDDDWLEMFSRIAETKSNEEVQLFLSKILAGEIRNPGTFGPKTIQTLSLLDKETAQLFLNFCNISFEQPLLGDGMTCVISQPFGSPGNNTLKEFGLSYSNLTLLQDAGLIQQSLTSWREFNPVAFSMPFTIGNEDFHLIASDTTPRELTRVNILNFTKVGLELRKVMKIENNPNYNRRFQDWIKENWNLNRGN